MIVENHALWGEEPTEEYPATFTYLGAEPLPDKPNGRRPAVIICGGGGFTHIAPHEQDPVASAFLDHGYQAFVLNYVTSSTGDVSFPHPQADLAKMVAAVRANADEWHVDPKRVCVVGFSAGGMICASLATQWKTGPFAALAGARPDDIRPDAVVLGYPLLDFAYVRDMQTRDPRIDLRVPKTGGKTGRDLLNDYLSMVTGGEATDEHLADICPTTLSDLAATMNLLGEKAKQVQVLFISVDPARDTPDLLAQYVPAFHPSFIGLTGSPEDIAKVAKQYQAFYKRHDAGQGKPYTMDHSAGSYVFDRQGHIRLNVPYGSGAAIFAHDIAALLK